MGNGKNIEQMMLRWPPSCDVWLDTNIALDLPAGTSCSQEINKNTHLNAKNRWSLAFWTLILLCHVSHFYPVLPAKQIPQLKRMTSKWYWLFLFSKLSHYKQKMNNVSQSNVVRACKLWMVCAIILSIRIFCISFIEEQLLSILVAQKINKSMFLSLHQ